MRSRERNQEGEERKGLGTGGEEDGESQGGSARDGGRRRGRRGPRGGWKEGGKGRGTEARARDTLQLRLFPLLSVSFQSVIRTGISLFTCERSCLGRRPPGESLSFQQGSLSTWGGDPGRGGAGQGSGVFSRALLLKTSCRFPPWLLSTLPPRTPGSGLCMRTPQVWGTSGPPPLLVTEGSCGPAPPPQASLPSVWMNPKRFPHRMLGSHQSGSRVGRGPRGHSQGLGFP